MQDAKTVIGSSGHIAIHMVPSETGDPAFIIEQIALGELVDLPDLATAREVYALLGLAILKAEIELHLIARGL